MAYTKIHAIKASVPKAVDYITDDEKTDGKCLISTFGCGAESVPFDFEYILSKTRQSDPNKAYHLIQSFVPGEVSPEEAHRIGTELADKVLEGKYSYIVSTHIDKDHVHNHIIFCAADNLDHRKFDCNKHAYRRIRTLSDELCVEHGLSIISPSQEKGKSYKEWLAERENKSWKATLRRDIDQAIAASQSYEDFGRLMREKGYEVKGEGFAENDLKFICFRAPGYERFVRGSARSLGADYTKERIKERIENRELPEEKIRTAFPKKPMPIITNLSGRRLIDTEEERFENSPGLRHWADIQNLKIAAAAYNEAGSIAELKLKISDGKNAATRLRESLVDTEHRMKELAEVLRYAEQYKENRIYHVRYEKSKNKDRYLREHETQLILYDGAKTMLKRLGIRPSKDLDIDQIRADYEALCKTRDDLKKSYKSAEKESSALLRRLEDLDRYLDRGNERDPKTPEHQQKRSNPSL